MIYLTTGFAPQQLLYPTGWVSIAKVPRSEVEQLLCTEAWIHHTDAAIPAGVDSKPEHRIHSMPLLEEGDTVVYKHESYYYVIGVN